MYYNNVSSNDIKLFYISSSSYTRILEKINKCITNKVNNSKLVILIFFIMPGAVVYLRKRREKINWNIDMIIKI
jgi:hypothetical protein